MGPSAFQSFVAWRYLLARPRRVSGIILVFTLIALWVTGAAGAALAVAPLADGRIAFAPILPPWLAPALGGTLMVAPVLLFGAAGRQLFFARQRSSLRVRLVSVILFSVALMLVSLGLWARKGSIAWAQPDLADHFITLGTTGAGLLLAGAVLVPLLARPDLAPPRLLLFAGWGGLAMLAVLGLAGRMLSGEPWPEWYLVVAVAVAGAIPLRLALRFSHMLRSERVVAWLIAIGSTAVMVRLTLEGLTDGMLPGFEDGPAHRPVLAALALAAVGVVLLSIAVIRRASRRSWTTARGLGLMALALATFALAAASYLTLAGRAGEELDKYGAVVSYQQPMGLVIPAAIAGALIALSLILLAIRYFFTFFSTVSIGGVTIGTMALVIVLSVMSGFENDLREKILGSNAHIMVTLDDESQFTDYREVGERIAAVPGVVAHTPYLVSEVVIAANNNYANVVIKGIEPHTVGQVTELKQDLEDERGLRRLWPLFDDGGVRDEPPPEERADDAGPPADAGPGGDAATIIDQAPADLEVGGGAPIDWSGGLTETPPEPVASDEAPPDLELDQDEPIDWSGGLTETPLDADAGPGPDASLRAGLDDALGDAGAAPLIAVDDVPAVRRRHARDRRIGGVYLFDGPLFKSLTQLGRLDLDSGRHLSPRVAALPGVLVGKELVKQINLYPGEEVKVVSPLGQDSPIGPVPRTKPYRVAGVFFTGMYEYDLKSIYVELGTLQDFLDIGDEVTGIEVRVRDPDDTGPVRLALAEALGSSYRVQDWKEINRSLFSALKLEKIAMFLVLAIIILVASFSIVGNLIMVVVEKAKEIAVLKTLGAADSAVMQVFVIQGFFIGLVGTAVGVSLGLQVCWLGIEFGLPLNPDVYYIDRLPIHVEPLAVLAVVSAGLLISVLATLYPAYIAARLRPIKGLRYE